MCVDECVQQHHLIITGISIDYKKQVMIMSIKLRMQCFIYRVPPKEYENSCKTWTLKIYKNT